MAFVNNQLQAPATLEQLQAELAQVRHRPSRDDPTNTRALSLIDQIQRMQQGSGGGGGGNSQDDMVRRALEERAGVGAGPYDEATRNALMTQASDTAGQVMLNSRARIRGSAGDPSVMAANNEADARRLATIQGAQLGINTQANVANYNARGQALGQLAGYNQNQQDFLLRQSMANNQAMAQAAWMNSQSRPQQIGGRQQPQQPQQPRQPTGPRNNGLIVAPTAPDMSGWTNQQRNIYTGQQPQQQQPVGVVRQQPVNTGVIHGPPLRLPTNEPYTAANYIPNWK